MTHVHGFTTTAIIHVTEFWNTKVTWQQCCAEMAVYTILFWDFSKLCIVL